jgi:hypothetical protein
MMYPRVILQSPTNINPSLGQAWGKPGASLGQAWDKPGTSLGQAWGKPGASLGQARSSADLRI